MSVVLDVDSIPHDSDNTKQICWRMNLVLDTNSIPHDSDDGLKDSRNKNT